MSLQTLRSEAGRDPGHVIKAKTVSDTTPITLIFEMAKADNFSLQLVWTGTIAATVAVYCSNSYNPNMTNPQDETIALWPGNWINTGARYLADFTAPAGSAGTSEIHGSAVECAWLKLVFTPTGGAGVVDGYLSGKSI
jgi:hypothetical protein